MGNFDVMLQVRRLMMFGLAVLIGIAFQYMSVPIPFLLGGIVSSMFWKIIGAQVYWPRQWRELGLCVAGYGIGRNFTAETMHELTMQSIGVIEATLASVGASIIIAWWTSRHSYANLQSCVMGCMPGGLTQMMLMSETDKRVDFSVVMVMQTLRLMGAIIIIPFLVVHGLGAEIKDTVLPAAQVTGYHWLWMVPIAAAGAVILQKLHIPTPRLLGPTLAASACSYFFGTFQPVPDPIMTIAQISIGLYMGMLLDPVRIKETARLLPFIISGILIIIAVSVGMAYYLSGLYGFSLITAFLATAPGGIAEMCLAGMSMGENVSIILTYQLVRMLILNVTVPMGLMWYFKDK